MRYAFLLVLCVFLTATVAEARIIGQWFCFDKFAYPKPATPIVRANAHVDPSGEYIGDIWANGIKKDSAYQQQGLTHRWDFDFNPYDGTYDAAFVIKADGTGLYYYFGEERETKPSLFTACEKVK